MNVTNPLAAPINRFKKNANSPVFVISMWPILNSKKARPDIAILTKLPNTITRKLLGKSKSFCPKLPLMKRVRNLLDLRGNKTSVGLCRHVWLRLKLSGLETTTSRSLTMLS
mmetsp:Transcript_23109/g.26575  ORF Transcript_23109/g.26575 Transcript_23109/m.26575 type:complete len:112 (+) Transcript_23109:252-587(+)